MQYNVPPSRSMTPDHEVNRVDARDLRERVARFSRNRQRVVVVHAELLAAFGSSGSDARPEVEAFGIAANEGFRENNEFGASFGRVASEIRGFLDCPLAAEQN